jgi:hypothetical protein
MFQQQSCMVRNGIVARAEYVGIVAKCHNPCPRNIQMKKVSKPKTSIFCCSNPEQISFKAVNCNDAGFPLAYKLCYKTLALAYSTSGLFPPSCNTVNPRSLIIFSRRLKGLKRPVHAADIVVTWPESRMRQLRSTRRSEYAHA